RPHHARLAPTADRRRFAVAAQPHPAGFPVRGTSTSRVPAPPERQRRRHLDVSQPLGQFLRSTAAARAPDTPFTTPTIELPVVVRISSSRGSLASNTIRLPDGIALGLIGKLKYRDRAHRSSRRRS